MFTFEERIFLFICYENRSIVFLYCTFVMSEHNVVVEIGNNLHEVQSKRRKHNCLFHSFPRYLAFNVAKMLQ